jgi:hypothetical protein
LNATMKRRISSAVPIERAGAGSSAEWTTTSRPPRRLDDRLDLPLEADHEEIRLGRNHWDQPAPTRLLRRSA